MSVTDAQLREILTRVRTIACVGVSPNPVRPSHFVGRYLAMRKFTVLPINPAHAGKSLFGQTVLGDLAEIPARFDPVDMVDIFRRSDQAGAVVDQALEVLGPRGLSVIWMQIGVEDAAAADRSRAQGVTVIMNRCPKIEYQRLFGELRMGGFNTGVISSKL